MRYADAHVSGRRRRTLDRSGNRAAWRQQQPAKPAPQPPPADAAAQQPPPVFRAGINYVRVDVIISDKNGNPVADLQASDFDVAEDGKPQKIDTFKLIKLDGGTADSIKEPPKEIRNDFDEESEAARDDVRLFAIFLDDYHVRRGTSMAVRGQLARFIDTQIGPSDMIGVMYPLESTGSVRMTRNHSAVSRGPSAVPRPQVRVRTEEPVRRTATRTIRRKRSSGCATRCRCRRSRR